MDNVPAALRALGWAGFRAELGDDGKWHKTPYQIGAPRRWASNADPSHWRNEGDVREVQILAPELFDGFAVALVDLANITFIDLDHVRDPETGELEPWAARMVETFDSWTEVSVSGTGLHIFCYGRLPGSGLSNHLDGNPDQKVEASSTGRFAILTGCALEPVRPFAERQRLVSRLARYVRPLDRAATSSAPVRDETPIPAGMRNDRLFRIARGFVRHGLRGRALEEALGAVNLARCVPPLPPAEVRQLARHAETLPDRRLA
jgi:primase-polymerase (primpol)-like protein